MRTKIPVIFDIFKSNPNPTSQSKCLISFLSIYDKDYSEIAGFFSNQPSRILFSVFIVIAFFFSALTISEIFEDYLQNDKIKYVANKALNLFAILIPLFTILSIYNLK